MTATAAPTAASDRVERSIHIAAPRSRVWRALTDAGEFGAWFGVDLKGQRFAPGERLRGPITACGRECVMFDALVERVEPEHLMAWRWHPYAVDAKVDYTKEEPTLVTFTLKEVDGGTLLTVVESGFDKVPPARRFEAFRMNDAGWGIQLENVRRHAAAS